MNFYNFGDYGVGSYNNISKAKKYIMIIILFDFRQLKWVVKGAERIETLISISTDGLVLEWNLKKGLVVSTLMQLKKSGTVNSYNMK